MCTAVHPEVSRMRKLPMGAKIFLKSKNRPLHVTESPTEIGLRTNTQDRVFSCTNLNGEETVIDRDDFISVVGPTPDHRVPVDIEGAMFGKRVTVREMKQDDADSLGMTFVEGNIVVEAEDLGREIVVVLDSSNGQVVYRNQADTDRTALRAVEVGRLAAEMVAIHVAENTPTPAAE